MPPGAVIFAVGRDLQSDLLLFLDDLLDLAVLDLRERVGGNLAALALGASCLEGRGAQQAADVVGAIRRLVSSHGLPRSIARRGAGGHAQIGLQRAAVGRKLAARALVDDR